MKTCFDSPMRITQTFGNKLIVDGKEYYIQFNMIGHNGIDAVPQDKGQDIIYPINFGKIICKELHKVYGNRIGILIAEATGLCEWHNHMEWLSKDIQVGDLLNSRVALGKMGNTGGSFGAHNHIGYCFIDKKGNRLNYDNGYLGWIDPMQYIN